MPDKDNSNLEGIGKDAPSQGGESDVKKLQRFSISTVERLKRRKGIVISLVIVGVLVIGIGVRKLRPKQIVDYPTQSDQIAPSTSKSELKSEGLENIACSTHEDCPYEIIGDVGPLIPKNPAFCDSGSCREPLNESEWEKVLVDYKTFLRSVVSAGRGGHADVFNGGAVPLGFINTIFCEGNKMDHEKCPFHSQNISTVGDPIEITKPQAGDAFRIGDELEIIWSGGPDYKGGRTMTITVFRSDNEDFDFNPWDSKENPYYRDTFYVSFGGMNSGNIRWLIPEVIPNRLYGSHDLIPADNYYLQIRCGYGFSCTPSQKVGPFSIVK